MNIVAENLHQPTRRRERKMQRFKSPISPALLVRSCRRLSVHAAVQNNFNVHPAARSASSGTKRSGRGEPPPRPELVPSLLNFAPPIQVAVTKPRHLEVTNCRRGSEAVTMAVM